MNDDALVSNIRVSACDHGGLEPLYRLDVNSVSLLDME